MQEREAQTQAQTIIKKDIEVYEITENDCSLSELELAILKIDFTDEFNQDMIEFLTQS